MLLGAADSSGSSWPNILYGGIGGVILLLAIPATARWISGWLARRRARSDNDAHEAQDHAILARQVAEHEAAIQELRTSMQRVLVFIEGSKDPFTNEVTGGLINTLDDILRKLKEGRAQ